MKKLIIYTTSLLMLFMCIGINTGWAQKKQKTRVRAYYQKLVNNNKEIKVILTVGGGKNMKGVANADVLISSIGGEEKLDLATIQTNAEGEGFLHIEDGYTFETDEDGYIVLDASFAGNDTLRSANRKVEFMELDLDIEFTIKDSVKVIVVTALYDSAGTILPRKDIDVQIGIQRLHSVLFLTTVETNKRGKANYEFPDDIPGDDSGNLKFVVRVNEDNDFGTVTVHAEQKWGTIVDYSIASNGRSLFGDSAPLWMIIGVIIVLGGAWYHFVWAIIKVWKIKKLG